MVRTEALKEAQKRYRAKNHEREKKQNRERMRLVNQEASILASIKRLYKGALF